tara:strand:- start:147 stop:620 length:474 start_codon:yes stop_codon:yes gene_type:complete
MIFLSKYICNWYQLIFYIWFFLGYYLGNQTIKTYINPYYVSIVSIILYVMYDIYLIFILGYQFEYTLQFLKIVTHLLPLFVLIYLKEIKIKYAMKTLVVTTILYLLFLESIQKSIYRVYFVEPVPRTWIGLKEACSKKNTYMPICILSNIIDKIITH